MINYTPISQQKIEGFATPFSAKLSPTNRWVSLAEVMPWDKLAQVYYRPLERNKGRQALNARIVIGAMVIKHILNLSDRETVNIISENPYMQYFLGLDAFQSKPLFDASLFVKIRKRMGAEVFDEFTTILIKEVKEIEHKKDNKGKDKKIVQAATEIEQEVNNQESGVVQRVRQVEKDAQVKREEPAGKAIEEQRYGAENNVLTSRELPIEGNGKEEVENQQEDHRAAIDENNKVNVLPEDSEQMVEVKPVREQVEKPKLKGKMKLDATLSEIYTGYT